tara:strand:- start:261 stop:425 length:165 start_codon:yes stop_codon:yes gene_type:complete
MELLFCNFLKKFSDRRQVTSEEINKISMNILSSVKKLSKIKMSGIGRINENKRI